MKKYLLLLLSFLLIPTVVNADPYNIGYSIGDEVSINLKTGEEPAHFHVIRESKPGETYVWVLYSGNVGDETNYLDSSTVYDIPEPPTDEGDDWIDATTVLTDAKIYPILINGTKDWDNIEGRPRLLNLDDIEEMGLKKDQEGNYIIPGNMKFLEPIVFKEFKQPELYNYWTMIADETVDYASVYAVIRNEEYDGDSLTPVAYIKAQDISEYETNPKFVVRPVAKVDKKYIDCYEEIEPEDKPKDVQTSETILPFEFLAVAGISLATYILIKKKKMFY